MGIPIIEELKNRLHRSAIAGTVLLQQDFRLKRTVEQLEKPAAANPIFKKMYEQGMALVNGTAKCPQEELLDLIALVDAVLVTTSGTIEGEAVPLQTKVAEESLLEADGSYKKQYRYSELMPLYQALITKGSGRYEVVDQAFREQSGVLRDIRLEGLLVAGLGDSYTEMVSLILKILCSFGESILPALKQGFDLDGKSDMIRRIDGIEAIAGAKENDFYCMVVEKGKDKVRQRAIYALRLDKENVPRLLALADTERGSIKKTVLSALGQIEDERVDEYFKNYTKNHKDVISKYLVLNDSEAVSDMAAEYIETLNEHIEKKKEEADKNTVKWDKEDFDLITKVGDVIINKTSPRMLKALEAISFKDLSWVKRQLEQAKDSKGNRLYYFYNYYSYRTAYPLTKDSFTIKSAYTAILTNNPEYEIFVQNMLKKQGLPYLPAVLLMAFRYHPEQAYDLINPYLKSGVCAKLLIAFQFLYYDTKDHSYYLMCTLNIDDGFHDDAELKIKKKLNLKLDLRLVELLLQDVKANSNAVVTLQKILNPDDEEMLALYRKYFIGWARQGRDFTDFEMLIRCKNTDWKGILCSYMKNLESYSYQHVFRLYKELEIDEQEKIEELTETLHIIDTTPKKKDIYIDSFKKQIEDYIQDLTWQRDRKLAGSTAE